MRFGRTSTLSLLSTAGLAWALGWGCAAKDTGSTFTQAAGSGTNSGTNSSTTGSSGTLVTGTGSGTNSTTTIAPPPTSGTGGAGGSGGIDPDANCGATKQGTTQIPTDIFIMEDKSGSMLCAASDPMCNGGMGTPPTRWDAFTTAINAFVASPMSAGIGVGLSFFGIETMAGGMAVSCNVADYSTAVVPIAPLPGNAGAITTAVGMAMPNGGTPTLPALQGAIQYAQQYTMMTPGRTAAVVLVTDGYPTGCNGNNINALNMAAQQAFQGTPPIKTYVVGIGNVANLDSIAHRGVGVADGMACPWSPAGTTECYFNANGDVTARLSQALQAISGMITCNYTIPRGSDPRLVNVEVTVGMGGMPTRIGKVDNAAACGALGGWYYDNPTTPTQIILCPQSCGPLQMTPNSGVSILYGCPSVPPA